MTPEELIARQLESYNAHDLEGFCACYAEDVELYNQHEPEPYLSSKDALRELYRQKFANAALHAEIAARIAKGAFVIDRERVTGVGDSALDVVVIYEVAEGLIRRVSFIR
ncbi:MAG TPA: nuclear transport factor 2 family protein [Spirochaetales bacterium]|nr:nuclear transport factor 2 family protein [Spirochaetales bacterium]HRY55057.1 nuclear transport factor 2 family protein [Spirochaetia bacterium]HRZ64228.1 nuclear transport factor 2 family protein [Spirochaetia bacterium]